MATPLNQGAARTKVLAVGSKNARDGCGIHGLVATCGGAEVVLCTMQTDGVKVAAGVSCASVN